ncbi:hypothetical protein TNIN_168191 [Trichonephila inaurata madagascariensis]|uniref:Uncharacterized protein n=1 Tax=Trichonephila inaurata madagascariensis TaxID=2747483 RepID=A0A8X7CRQ1_9ARAC|nr:hypothetical protein TNIN_168191 [Trichonephila inaurata madagascariensis]
MRSERSFLECSAILTQGKESSIIYFMRTIKLTESKYLVRSGIRTHAHARGLRPERSTLDRSAILQQEVGFEPTPTLGDCDLNGAP